MTTVPEPKVHGCDRCGKAEAHLLDDLWICDDCYSAMGSCCAGEQCDDDK